MKQMATRMLHKVGTTVRVYADAAELALKSAQLFARLADQYVLGDGRFSVVLSGGSTPRAMLQVLAQEPFVSTVPWASIFFFWGDERCVAPDHADSNFHMADEALLAHVPVPRENIFRIPAEQPDPHKAAQEYSETLRQFFVAGYVAPKSAPLKSFPRFDLVWLGVGLDGHTASLFPETTALKANKDIAVENYVEKLNAHRVTLTAATLNNARNIAFLVAGADKAATLKQVIEDTPQQPQHFPSQLIKPANGTLLWMVDEAAASQLRE